MILNIRHGKRFISGAWILIFPDGIPEFIKAGRNCWNSSGAFMSDCTGKWILHEFVWGNRSDNA